MSNPAPTCLILDSTFAFDVTVYLFPDKADPTKPRQYVTLADFSREHAARLAIQKALGSVCDFNREELMRLILSNMPSKETDASKP